MRKSNSAPRKPAARTSARKTAAQKRVTVPRDPDAGRTDDSESPLPRHHSARGEAKRVRGTLDADSPPARALHERPPRGRGQLTVGSGGDAARPGKTGIAATSIQPRRGYGRS